MAHLGPPQKVAPTIKKPVTAKAGVTGTKRAALIAVTNNVKVGVVSRHAPKLMFQEEDEDVKKIGAYLGRMLAVTLTLTWI
jgi:hypothetical protein